MTYEESIQFKIRHEGHGKEKNKYKGGQAHNKDKEITMQDWESESELYIITHQWDIGHADFISIKKIKTEENKR